ncbi:hypothetical protein ACJ41O_009270 [Fusarium nematophilum]
MQFMSLALGWEDCVILAMAPIGIITILVSAIRVGGPAGLKALVGRARENFAAAEMELMSSTSSEVHERYNGQRIVRCQGSTPVWEFIYLIPVTPKNQNPNKKLKIKAVTLEEACGDDKKLLHKSKSGTRKRRPRSSLVSAEEGVGYGTFSEPNDTLYVIRNMNTGAPNIILNLQNTSGSRTELRLFTLFGIVLQVGVLVFDGIITCHPAVKTNWPKGGQPVGAYGFYFAAAGTFMLILGIFLCGMVVEQSTKETYYRKNDKFEMRVVWIQPKQAVGSQDVGSFAMFPGSPQDIITMSRRCDKSRAGKLAFMTILGVPLGLVGFIGQLFGVGVMHKGASLAQLGAVVTMVLVRPWVRKKIAEPPRQEKLATDFELDSLAWALTLLSNSRTENPNPAVSPANPDQGPQMPNNTRQGNTHQQVEPAAQPPNNPSPAEPAASMANPCQRPQPPGNPSSAEHEVSLASSNSQIENPEPAASLENPDQRPQPPNNPRQSTMNRQAEPDPQEMIRLRDMGQLINQGKQKQYSWIIWTGENVEHQPLSEERPSSNSKAQQVLETRRTLSRLAQFQGTSATEAINLATAMEKVMDTLFPLDSEDTKGKEWTWRLGVIYSDSESTESLPSHVHLPVTAKDGSWKVLADYLESVLSLCLFTAQKQDESESKDDQPAFGLNEQNDDWLRRKTMRPGLGIRLIGSTDAKKTHQLIQDLRWWAPETFDTLIEIQEVSGLQGKSTKSATDNAEGEVGDEDVQSYSSSESVRRLELDEIMRSDPKLVAIVVNDSRVVGYGPQSESQDKTNNSMRQRHFRSFKALEENERIRRRRGTLAIQSNDSLKKLYAKDLLFSFLFSAAKTLPGPLRGQAKTRATATESSINSTAPGLITDEVALIAAEFGRLGYGTGRELLLSIVAPLSLAEKLPIPRPLFDSTRHTAGKMYQENKWWYANQEYLKLWHQTQLFASSTQRICAHGSAFLLEHLRDVEAERKLAQAEKRRPLKDLSDELVSVIRESKSQPGFLAHLLRLYEKQGRPLKLDSIRALAGNDVQGSFPAYFNITKLHLKAMESSEENETIAIDGKAWDAVNERDVCDWTPLHYASAGGSLYFVRTLLSRGANPNLEDLHGFTPVHYACRRGDSRLLGMLQGVSGVLDARGIEGATPMHVAAADGNLDLIESCKAQIARRLKGSFGKHDLILPENLWRLRDHNGRVPVLWATIHGREAVVEKLRDTVDEPNIFGWTSLHLAVLHREHDSRLIQRLVRLSAKKEKVDRDDRTALMLACEHRKIQAVRWLMAAGANVNAVTPGGSTALHHAVEKNAGASVIEALIDEGAKVELPNNEGQTPFHIAPRWGADGVLGTLLGALDRLDDEARSLIVNSRDWKGDTALHLAARWWNLEATEMLLSAGADPNLPNNDQKNSLHSALYLGDEDNDVCLKIVEALI